MPASDGTRSRQRIIVPVIIAITAALVTVMVVLTSQATGPGRASAPATSGQSQGGQGQDQDGQGQDGQEQSAADQEFAKALNALARRIPHDPLARGAVDAPVVMVAFSDFQCPYCGDFARTTETELVERYVETGILRIEWRDFPYLGEESRTAALAARAAGQQDGFWAFHEALFADPPKPNSGALTVDHLVAIAQSAGLDGARLRADMASGNLENGIERDFREGQQIGVNGTPSFVINGKPVIGAQPLEVFTKAIEQAAAQAR